MHYIHTVFDDRRVRVGAKFRGKVGGFITQIINDFIITDDRKSGVKGFYLQ